MERQPGNGTYTVIGLPAGTYRVHAQAPGHANELYDEKLYFSNHDEATPVIVTVNTDTPDIDFTLDPGGTITGTVFMADGETPLGDVQIDTAQWGGYGRCSDPVTGTFTIEGLPLNTPLYVYAGGQGGCPENRYIREYWLDARDLASAQPIMLTAGGGENAVVTFRLDMGGSISGTVTETDGETPITNAQVCVNEYP